MSFGINFKLEGATNLISELSKKIDESNNALKQAVNDSAAVVVKSAKIFSPHDTGLLQSNISFTPAKKFVGDQNWTSRVGSNIEYAPYLELSSPVKKPRKGSKSSARIPFLLPALKENYGKIQNIISKAIKEATK